MKPIHKLFLSFCGNTTSKILTMDTSELKIEILESVNIPEDVMENFFENIAEDIENFESFEFEPQSFEDEYLYTLPGHWMVEMNPIFGLFDMTAYNASDSKLLLKVTTPNGLVNCKYLEVPCLSPVVFAMYKY